MTETGKRDDPFPGFNFRIEINGLTLAGFADAGGLTTEGEVIEYRVGTHPVLSTTKLFGLRTFANITLHRGMTSSRELWRWRLNIINGVPDRRSGAVVLLDERRQRVTEWRFEHGWPVKYDGPTLDASKNEVALEGIEIAHEGLRVV